MDIKTKVCVKCGRELPVGMFNKHAESQDGLQPYCRLCQSEYSRKYHEKRKEAKKDDNALGSNVVTPAPKVATPAASTTVYQSIGQKLAALKAFSIKELTDELRGRGVSVLLNPTPRDAMEFLVKQGYKGQLQYIKVETIDLSRI